MFRRNPGRFGNDLKQDHDLAKIGAEGSSPFARSKNFQSYNGLLSANRREAVMR
jgi:hypothetical protein